MAKTYSEKLQDPRWQRKRLEILEREDFRCESCGAKDKALHVHHCWYERGQEPWGYPDKCYKVYCGECHERAEIARHRISLCLFAMPLETLENFEDQLCHLIAVNEDDVTQVEKVTDAINQIIQGGEE